MAILIATVEPWTRFCTSRGAIDALSRQSHTPCESSFGVVSDLACSTRPVCSSNPTRSVKVPPISTAMLRDEAGCCDCAMNIPLGPTGKLRHVSFVSGTEAGSPRAFFDEVDPVHRQKCRMAKTRADSV